MNPVPSCPHCGEGSPYRCEERFVCNRCYSTLDPRQLQLWRLNLATFLEWIAGQWKLRGGVRRIDRQLWQLGTLQTPGSVHECFFSRGSNLSEAGRSRVAAYKQSLLLNGVAPTTAGYTGRTRLCLLELLQEGKTLSIAAPSSFLRPHGNVRFDAGSGAVWAGEAWLGEVPVGSKEFFLLASLSNELDHFVPYQDLKDQILRSSSSADSTEEATFCQRLKNRIKSKWVPEIDRLIATTNKGDGYRLRGYVDL